MSIMVFGILLLMVGATWKILDFPDETYLVWLQEGLLVVGLIYTLYGVYLNYVTT